MKTKSGIPKKVLKNVKSVSYKTALMELETIKKMPYVKNLPAIMGILNKTLETPKGVTVRGRGNYKLKGKTTGRAYRCRLDGCTGYRIVVKWEDGHFTHPCSKGMRLTKKGWRIL